MSRTEQLGLPQPRKLIATKQEFNHVLEEKKLQNLDKHLEKSIQTIYCKMVAQKPKQKKRLSLCQRLRRKKKKVTSNNDFEKWLVNISKPKKIFLPETMEPVKGKVDIKRLIRLSQPRNRPYPESDPNNIPKAALEYVATERISNLAQPRKEKNDDTIYEIPRISFPINPDYATVESLGIDRLSQPLHPRKKYHKVDVDVRCSYDHVSRGALQYEATTKIRKLAKPKNSQDEEATVDPYKVKKKALRKLQKRQEKVFLAMSTPIEWKVTPKFEK